MQGSICWTLVGHSLCHQPNKQRPLSFPAAPWASGPPAPSPWGLPWPCSCVAGAGEEKRSCHVLGALPASNHPQISQSGCFWPRRALVWCRCHPGPCCVQGGLGEVMALRRSFPLQRDGSREKYRCTRRAGWPSSPRCSPVAGAGIGDWKMRQRTGLHTAALVFISNNETPECKHARSSRAQTE